MAAIALPIREFSASVTLDAARTQKKCWDVVESAQHSGIIVTFKGWVAAWFVGFCFDKLISSQRVLIGKLEALDTDDFSDEHFLKLSIDLGNLTSMTFSAIDLANEIEKYSDDWRPKLDTISELASHLDNFAESYRIAADNVCTSLVASIAAKVMTEAHVPAH